MSRQAQIIFAKDDLVVSNDHLNHVVKTSKGDFTTGFAENTMKVIIKEVATDKQSAEKVRMIAGGIARELSQLKYDSAEVDEKALAENFSQLETNQLVTVFVEG